MRGISIKGLQGNYTVSKLKKKKKSLENTLKRINNVLKVMEKLKPAK